MTPAAARAAGAGRWRLGLAVGVAVTAAVACWAVRALDMRLVFAVVGSADARCLALSLGAVLTSIALKALRWRCLLSPEGDRLSPRRLLGALMLGQLGNALLPARLGDVARIWAVSVGGHPPAGVALLTLVAEKAIDSLMLVALTVAVLPFVAPGPWLGAPRLALGGASAVLLALGAVVATQARLRGRLLAAVARWPLGRRAAPAFDRASRLRAWRERRLQLGLWGLSLAIWLLAGLVNHLGFRAVHLRLPVTAGLLLAVTEMGGNRLAYAPAALGVYHSICVLTLSAFGVGVEAALAAAVLLHLVVYVPILAGGLAAGWLEGLDLRRLAPG